MITVGFNFHVGLPGPFSYNKRIGGSPPGPSASEQLEQMRVRGALRDLYCPEHLRVNNVIDWLLVAGAALLVALAAGWWAVAVVAVVAPIVRWRQVARDGRRAAHLPALATGEGCHRCEIDRGRRADRAQLRPLETAGRHRR